MKLLTKRLLAVAIVVAMTLGMAMSAMAISRIEDAKLRAVGLDPAKSEIVWGWIDIKDAADADGKSDEAGIEYVEAKNGTYTIDWSEHADYSKYAKFAMVHNYAGDAQEIVAGTSITVTSLSPFCLVGEKKDGSAADNGNGNKGGHKSHKSSSSGKKSPKTGMNDSWMLWLMAAGVFAGASVVAYNKKKG